MAGETRSSSDFMHRMSVHRYSQNVTVTFVENTTVIQSRRFAVCFASAGSEKIGSIKKYLTMSLFFSRRIVFKGFCTCVL